MKRLGGTTKKLKGSKKIFFYWSLLEKIFDAGPDPFGPYLETDPKNIWKSLFKTFYMIDIWSFKKIKF